jgi:uncharacterized protein (DUF934 family)
MTQLTMQLLSAADADIDKSGQEAAAHTLVVANTEDVRELNLDGVSRINLTFPKFTDGRAYTQAFYLRRRCGFSGEIRATGDVLIDQLVQMERQGFSVAVLRADQNLDFAHKQFERYRAFYQGDAMTAKPVFSRDTNQGAAA